MKNRSLSLWELNPFMGFLALVCLLAMALILPAQSTLNNVQIPPSPDAAALGRYAEIPVDLSTGLPQISVPIWNLEGRNLSVPVSLSYHASGIRVDDYATRVGLGWALQAGGVISRTVHGLPDESNQGYFNTSALLPAPIASSAHQVTAQDYTASEITQLYNLAEGVIDGSPDVFHLNFPGGNASMQFDQQGQPHLIPYGLVGIDINWTTNIWTLRTPDGVTYTFGGSAIENSNTHFGTGSPADIPAVTSWYLTKIEGPFNDVINLEYEAEGPICNPLPESQIHYLNVAQSSVCGQKIPQRSFGATCTQTHRIKKITSSRGSVDFIYEPLARSDQNSSHALKTIEVQDLNSKVVKFFNLKHSYWSNRLMLDAIVEGGNSFQVIPARRFSYNKTHLLPAPGSYNKDHWGFSNGAINQSAVPRQHLTGCFYIGNADREPNFDYVNSGSLVEIQYPSGGKTNFVYEPHTVWNDLPNDYSYTSHLIGAAANCDPNDPNCNGPNSVPSNSHAFNLNHAQCVNFNVQLSNSLGGCQARVELKNTNNNQVVNVWTCSSGGLSEMFLQAGDYEIIASTVLGGDQAQVSLTYMERSAQADYNEVIGGQRISRIVDHDGLDPAKDMVKEYVYETASSLGQSSGVLVSRPQYLSNYKEVVPSTVGGNPLVFTTCTWTTSQSSARSVVGNGGGSHIHYGEVKSLSGASGSNGWTISRYTTAAHYPDPSAGFPFGPGKTRSYLRGLPLYSAVYDATGKIISSKKNTYTIRSENSSNLNGLVAGLKLRHSTFIGIAHDELMLRPYVNRSEWFHLSETNSQVYDDNGVDFLETHNQYSYDNPDHIQLTETRTSDSEGREMITRSQYPQDFAIGNGDAMSIALKKLQQQKFMLNLPIEKTTWEKRANAPEKLLAAELTMYKEFSPGMILPERMLFLESEVPLSNFTPATVTGGQFSYHNSYAIREIAEKYDDFGHLLQATQKDGLRVSYIYGYGQSLPVAQILNASTPFASGQPNSPVLNGSTAYTSFETGNEIDHDPDEGFWTFQGVNKTVSRPYTGNYSRKIKSGSQQFGPIRELRPDQQSGRFIFSAWVKTKSPYAGGRLIIHTKSDQANASGVYPSTSIAPSYIQTQIPNTHNKWQYIEAVIDLDKIRFSGNVPSSDDLRLVAAIVNESPNRALWVDDLRILPQNARMSSYTYNPLIGQSSKLDENNLKSSFSFDSMQRLELIRDQNNHIRKRNQYAYAANELYLENNLLSNVANANTSIQFSALTTVDCSKPGAMQWQWDFGDASSLQNNSSTATHIYSNPGTYTLTLSVTDPAGRTANTTSIITIL